MPQQFDEFSWHVESYLITTNIAIKSLLFFYMYCVFVSVFISSIFPIKKKNFFFVPLFRGRQLTRRPYGHFAAFLCFRKLSFFSHILVYFLF